MEDSLKQLIDSSAKILVTSHISPDIDAVSSSLLVANSLRENYSDKIIDLVLEELPNQELEFLEGYSTIKNKNLASFVESEAPNLIIIVDASKFSRSSRNEGEKLAQLVKERGIKVAIIDHHESADKDDSDVYINDSYPAASQQVYHTLFDKLNLKKPAGYGEATLLGLLSDTLRFKYKNAKHRETFALVNDLIDVGIDIEYLENKLETYSKDQLEVIAHLITNLQTGNGYNYSFISDSFADQWQQSGKDPSGLKGGAAIFVNQFIRNIEPNNWGFLVSREVIPSELNYSVSFRAEGGSKAVSELAKLLGGGGHEAAAGAKFHAVSILDAVDKVLAVVENTSNS